jgi:hypothetical protein
VEVVFEGKKREKKSKERTKCTLAREQSEPKNGV